MKLSQSNLTLLLLVGCAALLTLQVESCFHRNRPDSYYKEKLADKEKQIQEVIAERDKARSEYDSAIRVEQKKDTVLIEKYNNLIKYEKEIPARVRNLSNEDLRRAINSFQN